MVVTRIAIGDLELWFAILLVRVPRYGHELYFATREERWIDGGTSRINARTMFKTEALSPSEATTISAIAGPLPLPKVLRWSRDVWGAVVLG